MMNQPHPPSAEEVNQKLIAQYTEIATLARRHGALPPPVALGVLIELLRLLQAEHAQGKIVGTVAATGSAGCRRGRCGMGSITSF